jgi:hypothetical protein
MRIKRWLAVVVLLLPAASSFSCGSKQNLSLSPEQLIERHINARGGSAALTAVRSRTVTKRETDSDGVITETVVNTSAPNAELVISRDAQGKELFRTFFDGITGYAELRGERQSLSENMLQQLEVDSDIFPELRFAALFPIASGSAEETWKGRKVFRLSAKSKAGYEEKFFFDAESGLMIGLEYPSLSSSYYFDNFETIDGIKYARTSKIERGGKSFTVQVVDIKHNIELDRKLNRVN